MLMMPYKLDPSCVYSDTDSVFTKNLLNNIVEGDGIGLFKDELNGKTIEKALFLGIKQYGYVVNDKGVIKEHSIFAGVPRNSIPFSDLQRLANNEILESRGHLRFYKSFHNLTIKTNVVSIKIKQNNFKTLINNKYLPLNINLIDSTNNYTKVFKLLLTKVLISYRKLLKSKGVHPLSKFP